MDEDFLDVTQTSSKKIFFALLFIIILLLGLGYVFVYYPHHFGLKTLTFEVGSELPKDVNEYLKDPAVDTSSYKLDTSRVKMDEVGTYEYYVTVNKNKKTGKIKVVDTTPPRFAVKENYEVEVDDEDFFIGDVLETCTDVSLPCLVTYKNAQDGDCINKVGTHTFTIVISDIYKNSAEATVTLSVLEKGKLVRPEQLDLTFDKASSELPGFKNEYYIKLDKALKEDSDDVRDVASEISADIIEEFVTTNYPNNTISSSEIVSMYNKSGYVIGFVVKITLNNNKVVYMTKKDSVSE